MAFTSNKDASMISIFFEGKSVATEDTFDYVTAQIGDYVDAKES